MANYIRAELYKVFRRTYTWITLAVVLVLETLLVAGWVFTNAHGNHVDFYTGAGMLCMMLSIGLYAPLITGDMVFAGQYKTGTLKNEVSFGLSRGRIYLGKFLVQLALSLLFLVVMLGYYVGLCYLALYRDPELDMAAIRMVGYCLATALPLWIGGLACTCACLFLVKSELGASLAAAGVIAIPAGVLEVAGLLLDTSPVGTAVSWLRRYMPTVMLDTVPAVVGDWNYCGQAWLVGAVWLVVFTAIGLLAFRQREIK